MKLLLWQNKYIYIHILRNNPHRNKILRENLFLEDIKIHMKIIGIYLGYRYCNIDRWFENWDKQKLTWIISNDENIPEGYFGKTEQRKFSLYKSVPGGI